MTPTSTHTIIWQVVAPDDVARQEVERLLRRGGHRIIHHGVLPVEASLGIVRDAITITTREREVLSAMLEFDHNREIAEALGVSVAAVGFHLRNLMRQFGVGSRHRLLASALLCGLLPANLNASSENPSDA